MKKMLLFLLFALYINASGSMMFDPDTRWRSVKTEHFWIHYHDGLEDAARRMSVIAERVHSRLSADIGWMPSLRTDIVLADNMDMSNGFATPFPHNRVQIFISRPEIDGVLSNFNDWLELVFVHEYVHILNLDSITGVPAFSRYTCGRVCFPNSFLPIWQVEGNAVYHESRGTIYGRNNSTYTDMILRCEIEAGSLKDLDEASHYPREWPAGSVPYLYGGLFVEYLENRFGRNSYSKLMLENTDNILPYLVNYNAKGIYGQKIFPLYTDWQKHITLRYKGQIDAIKKQKITHFDIITDSGIRTSLPRFHPDGKALYYIRSTDYNRPSLMKYTLSKGVSGELCDVNFPNSIAVTEKGSVFFTDLEIYRNYSVFSELFSFDGNSIKHTKKLRALHMDAMKNGSILLYTRQDRDRYQLIKSDRNLAKTLPIIDGTNIQIAHPRISPEGKRVVFSIKDTNGYTDLVLFDEDTSKFVRLTNDRYNDIHPAWHPGGGKIVYTSDKSGVYNLYELNVTTGESGKITNLTGGAFSPDVSPDGKSIAFSVYSHKGFNIAMMDYPEISGEKVLSAAEVISKDFFSTNHPGYNPGEIPGSTPYSIWRTVFPTMWIPIYYTEEVYDKKYDSAFGFFTMGNDTLYHYSYTIGFQYLTYQERGIIEADLIIAPFYPNILLSYNDDSLFFGKDEFPWEDHNENSLRRTVSRKGAGGLSLPFINFRTTHFLLIAYRYDMCTTDYYIPGYIPLKRSDTLVSLRGAYYFSGTRMYSYSISDEDGRSLYFIGETYKKSFGSDYEFYKIRGEYSEFLPGFWRNNVIMIRGRGGFASGNPEYLNPYTIGRYERGTSGSPPGNEESFGMRGYPGGYLYANRLLVFASEYRFPIFQMDLGYRTIPLMFRDIWAAVFLEYGNAWNGRPTTEDFRSSGGAELHMKVTLGYYLDITGYIGYARGFGDNGESQIYFGIATIYEGAMKSRNKWFDFL